MKLTVVNSNTARIELDGGHGSSADDVDLYYLEGLVEHGPKLVRTCTHRLCTKHYELIVSGAAEDNTGLDRLLSKPLSLARAAKIAGCHKDTIRRALKAKRLVSLSEGDVRDWDKARK
ncbi:MAG: hypothetical protein UY96_C0038G0005 [Parcubacteria group bacterium GW2011_GWB1_56_8]|nr:MAG: hypothetical protein UY96_C0038G0005 [Parcubacteria group bacterium GW2011_GWB1_56_8]